MSVKPQIVIENFQGRHNTDLNASANRLKNANTFKDLSTICIIPSVSGLIPAKVTQYWLSLFPAMNQKFIRFLTIGIEEVTTFNTGIEQILANPSLNTWPYILTMTSNSLPPPDGLLRLYESSEKYDVVGGLSFTTGVNGKPLLYGNPRDMLQTFSPYPPLVDTIQECNGVGMGFTLFKTAIFKDSRVPKPWFRNMQQYKGGRPIGSPNEDMYFFENIHRLGYKVACDTRVKVGNYDLETDMVW